MTIKTTLTRTIGAAVLLGFAALPAIAQETGDPGPAYVEAALSRLIADRDIRAAFDLDPAIAP